MQEPDVSRDDLAEMDALIEESLGHIRSLEAHLQAMLNVIDLAVMVELPEPFRSSTCEILARAKGFAAMFEGGLLDD